MSEAPSLPESDDPFELLGVDPHASALEIRRAYVRRIRQFRPETHPEEFARLRLAFESLGSHGARPSYGEQWKPEAPRPTPPSDAADPRWRVVSEAWTALADGDEDTSRGILQRLQDDHPRWAPAALHRFLIEDALVAPDEERLDVLARALEVGCPVLPAVFDLLEEGEVRRLSMCRECEWTVLRRQPDRPAAIRLCRLRHQELWIAGGEARVLREITSQGFAKDAMDSADLTWLAREAMSVLAWSHHEEAEELYSIYGTTEEGFHGLTPEDHYAVAREGAPALRRWRMGESAPPILNRFLRVVPILDQGAVHRLAADLFSAFVEAPMTWFDALRKLHAAAPDVLDRYVQVLRTVLDPYEEVLPEEPGPEARERIRRGLANAERLLQQCTEKAVTHLRILAAMIFEYPDPPAHIRKVLLDPDASRWLALRFQVDEHTADPALEAFYWTRRLGMLHVGS